MAGPVVNPEAIHAEPVPLLIAGLGNCLLMDDGVGVHAARELLREPIPSATVVEVGTAVLDALSLLQAAKTVLALDAIQAGGPPGTIYELTSAASRKPERNTSLHELDLLAALRLLPPGCRPHLIVLGVEPERIDYGLDLSPVVRAVLPEFVATVRARAADILRRRGG